MATKNDVTTPTAAVPNRTEHEQSTMPFEQLCTSQCMLFSLPLIMIQLLILTVVSVFDPPRQTEQLGIGTGIGVQQIVCEHHSNVYQSIQIAWNGMGFRCYRMLCFFCYCCC